MIRSLTSSSVRASGIGGARANLVNVFAQVLNVPCCRARRQLIGPRKPTCRYPSPECRFRRREDREYDGLPYETLRRQCRRSTISVSGAPVRAFDFFTKCVFLSCTSHEILQGQSR